MATRSQTSLGASRSWFLWVAPFLLPALFFQSSFFAFISPLPFFIVTLKNRTWISLLALFTNSALVYAFEKNLEILAFPVWFWFSIGISFPLFIRKFKRVPQAFSFSFGLALVFLIAAIQIMAHARQLPAAEYLRAEITLGVERMMALPDQPIHQWVKDQGKTELIKNLMIELPSGVLIAMIICYWLNLLLAFRTLPGFLSRSFWAGYRTPQWLVWPTILAASAYAYGEEAQAIYYIGLNTLKVLLVFYGFQGLSIMVSFMNKRQIFGFIRAVIYAFMVLVASPFVFALGFFDQWFDFRRKFGQL